MMKSILEFIGSTAVVMSMAGIVLLLSLWLIIVKIKKTQQPKNGSTKMIVILGIQKSEEKGFCFYTTV